MHDLRRVCQKAFTSNREWYLAGLIKLVLVRHVLYHDMLCVFSVCDIQCLRMDYHSIKASKRCYWRRLTKPNTLALIKAEHIVINFFA